MSFLDLAKKRCSTRAYQPVPVSQEHIDAIVEAARVAPTAANRQPVRILQVTSEEGLASLAKAANDIVRIGKQLLMTRGSLTTFSIANDVAKYFAIIPALFVPLYPALEALNIMRLTSPTTAILAAVIYNALIIVALIPLALKGVKYREATSQSLLKRNLAVYGLGGIVLPFAAIKLLDMGLTALGVA